VGPRAVLGAVVKRKIPSPRREAKPRNPIVQTVAQRCITELYVTKYYTEAQNWSTSTQDKNQWQGDLNTEMKFWVP
jgi:hypothetical protein